MIRRRPDLVVLVVVLVGTLGGKPEQDGAFLLEIGDQRVVLPRPQRAAGSKQKKAP